MPRKKDPTAPKAAPKPRTPKAPKPMPASAAPADDDAAVEKPEAVAASATAVEGFGIGARRDRAAAHAGISGFHRAGHGGG